MSRKNKGVLNHIEQPSAQKPKEKKVSDKSGFLAMTNWFVGLVFVLPFLLTEKLVDPVVPLRYLFLSCFTLLLVAVFFLFKRKDISVSYPLLIKMAFLIGVGYSLWSMVSLMQGINKHEGFYIIARQLLNMLLLWIVMITLIDEESHIIRIAKALTVVSFLQGTVGILQFYGIAFTQLPGNVIPYGFMANRNLFGSAQMLLLPFCLLVILQGNKWWKYTASVSGLTGIISIFISQTRSAWLATIVSIAVALLLLSYFDSKNRIKLLAICVAVAVIAAGAVVLLFFSSNNETFTSSIKERLNIFAQDSSVHTTANNNTLDRTTNWSKTIELIKTNPVMGVGPGNWKIAVPVVGSIGTSWENGKYVPDRPHNVYLHIASESGIIGAMLYFGMWLVIAFMALKVIQKTSSVERRTIAIFMLSVLVGFASDCMFSFPEERIEHTLYLIIANGIILGMYYNQFNEAKSKKILFPKWAATTFLLVAGINILIGIAKYNFQLHMNRAKVFDKASLYTEVMQEVEEGKSFFTTLDPNGKPLEIYSSIAYKQLRNYPMALQEGYKAEKYHPNSFLIYNNIGTIYTDMQQYDRAIENYEQALKLAPRSQNTLYNLAVNYFAAKRYSDCLKTIKVLGWEGHAYLDAIAEESERQLSAKQ